VSIRANVDAGRFTERVEIQRATASQDATTGAEELTWAELVTCWASVDGIPAREARAADAMQSLQDYTVWVRSDIVQRFSVTQADRIYWRYRVLDILAIPDQQLAGRLIAILCRAGASNG